MVGARWAMALVAGAALAPGAELRAQGGSVLRAAIDPSQGVNFRAAVDRNEVYVGEQVTYQVGVFLDDDTRHRLRRNPEFTPPEPRAMLAYDLPSPPGPTAVRSEAGRRYEVHVFQRALFPISPGPAAIPPARLSYALPLSNSFFAREERRTARADSLTVTVRPLPAAGRPADFAGAVGRFDLAVRVDSVGARVGDPLLLTVRVRGTGNVKLLPRPALALDWAQAVPSGERAVVDSGRMTVAGYKDFTWLVTPQRGGAAVVPALRYPYFDPELERYEVATAPPRPIRIGGGTLAGAVVVGPPRAESTTPALPLRRAFRGELAPVLPQRPWFWVLAFLLPVPAVALDAARRERRRARRSAAQELRTLARATEAPATLVRRRFTAALSERVALKPGALASDAALARALRRAGVTRETAADAAALVADLDAAAFASRAPLPTPMASRAVDVLARVDDEARHRFAPPLWGWVLVVGAAAALGAGTVVAADGRGTRAGAAFSEGLRHYQDRRFADAHRAFSEVTRLAPRAADAWANRGTSAWLASDTAAAAVGWQRAVRLEPTAEDVRDRLDLLPGVQLGGAAWVPPIPVSLAAGVALALWAGACGTAAWRVWHRRRASTRGAPTALALAAAGCAALAWRGETARTARALDVVTTTGDARLAPALGAEPGPALRKGEVVRVLARRGAWARVAVLDGDRDGWVEGERLASLRAD